MLEWLNEEIRWRTRVVCNLPNPGACLRLAHTVAVETHEGWLDVNRYLNMTRMCEHKNGALRMAA